MAYTYEVFLTKKHVDKEEWYKLIQILSDYNGTLRKWKVFALNQKGVIRYFVKVNCTLPATLNNVPSFLFRQNKNIDIKRPNFRFVSFTSSSNNLVDLINYNSSRNKGELICLEAYF